ncbi:DUF7024 domain-containing protein [Variovorax paradoxus]|uniref:DUF7024 domain-containing protein n=1 Tax=Variovorax paradoxus TaxID=34073 RepID=A0A6I6H8K7_VARPD|nr:hypothetical protein [Variovorax paradoxus]QGW80716.1 hypothetical protein GOQ09_03550 [Variovorax paradoxus]
MTTWDRIRRASQKQMFNKHKRILWLLNHRTLMPFEAPLIRRLGFEIFIPKIIPKTGFRSGDVDYGYDTSLSLPPRVLERLNEFNFYEESWPSDIVVIINRYFGAAFIVAHLRQASEAIDNFEGQIVFRAFGLENGNCYTRALAHLYGPMIHRKIEGIKHRFWFGEGYDNLHECESSLFGERALFLPIGVPKIFFTNAKQWRGKVKKILFVCPNAVTNLYYSGIYKKFKENFGDLPHVIVGAQDVPVADPHVVGFVSDDELHRLYLDCALLYYPSIEVRHVHYSPIEAAINGMPVIFFAGSLLDRLSRGSTKGRVNSIAEARELVERILAGDRPLIDEIKADQQEIAYHFSDAYCEPTWRRQMQNSGFFAAMQRTSKWQIAWIELLRSLLKPVAHGRLKINPHRRALTLMSTTLTPTEAKEKYGSSLFDGVSFKDVGFPPFVDLVDGISADEGWGRWSNGKTITIVLKHVLHGEFRLYVYGVAFGKNAEVPVPVRIGTQTRMMQLASSLEKSSGVWLHFNLKKPANVILITIPYPTVPEVDTRSLGVGLVKIAASPIGLSLEDAKRALGTTLTDGLDFRSSEFPAFVDSIQGLSDPEPWGRWSDGKTVMLELKHTLQGAFALILRAAAYGSNIGAPIAVRIGEQTRTMYLTAQASEPVVIEFDLKVPAKVIEIDVPYPTSPPQDPRKIGIGFYEMAVLARDAG